MGIFLVLLCELKGLFTFPLSGFALFVPCMLYTCSVLGTLFIVFVDHWDDSTALRQRAGLLFDLFQFY